MPKSITVYFLLKGMLLFKHGDGSLLNMMIVLFRNLDVALRNRDLCSSSKCGVPLKIGIALQIHFSLVNMVRSGQVQKRIVFP